MSEPWAFGGAPPADGGSAVTVIDGSSFCISDSLGDIAPNRAHGLFVRDTRMLSRWALTVDGARPEPLATEHPAPYAATFIARMPPPPGLADSTLLIVRRRYVGNGLREDIEVHNLSSRDLTLSMDLGLDADFADLFEVKDGRTPESPGLTGVLVDGEFRVAVERNARTLCLACRVDAPTVSSLGRTLHWQLAVPARGIASTTVEVAAEIDGVRLPLLHSGREPVEHAAPARNLRAWRQGSPVVHTGDAGLAAVLRQSLDDLGSLRIFDPQHPERAVVAAGAPWFMALFGRDSLLTSWMVLPLDSSLAIGTLRTLADYQGARLDLASEEEPGRILHEIRFGPAASLALGGGSVYYGTADATALFVMLLGEVRRWGRHHAEVRSLLPHADRALEWMLDSGDADGDGFVEYSRKTDKGLVNQGWKDSWDGVNFADGTLAEAPIALAEVQGYTYAAYLARAHFAEEDGDAATATLWHDRAASLKRAFNETFWLPDRGWFAVGLDRDKRPIDSLTSNLGHCLWTGIIDDDKAAAVADHLLSDDMFTGWGVRTLAASMQAYNPLSYHNGSVWPHDNAICVAGLARYGFVEHAQRLATGLLEAATHFGNRLPELFGGFDRTAFHAPVAYPTSCSPQAWAAAAPLLLMRALLRFDPHLAANEVWCDPALPERYLPLRISNLRLGDSLVTVEVNEKNDWAISGLHDSGVRVTRTPRPAT